VRQLFTSPRIENVERLEALLQEAGIATRVTNRSSYLSGGKPYFGYSERNTETRWPALWVVEADDYPRARQLLREAGLLEGPGNSSFYRETKAPEVRPPDYTAKRVRLLLFAIVLGLTVLALVRMVGWR
jgi:hypothetical protein